MTRLKHLWLVALVGCGGSTPPPGLDGGPIDSGPMDAGAIDGGSIAATVTRYDYRFDLASGEASSRLAVLTDATGSGCVAQVTSGPLSGKTRSGRVRGATVPLRQDRDITKKIAGVVSPGILRNDAVAFALCMGGDETRRR